MTLLIKHLYFFAALLAGCSLLSCSDKSPQQQENTIALAEIFSEYESSNPYDTHLDTVIDDNCKKLRVKQIGSLSQNFKDMNDVHLSAARQLGFKPIKSGEDIMNLSRPIVRIASCREYFLDDLTHSFPYLVPEAATLLSDIGRTFNDSLAARGGGAYRIKVTSVLRTPATVKSLRRVNRNATEESTHSYGTTFDISYSRFVCDSICEPFRTYEDLKNLLAEVLYDLRKQGRCYVKYEIKQSCFHITTRPTNKK